VETSDKGHGRREVRRLWACPITPEEIGFCGAAQLVRIQRIRWEGDNPEPSVEEVFAITSLRPEQADPAKLLRICRCHWSIENGTHYRRDRTFDEDRLPVREPKTAALLGALRCLAIFHLMRRKAKERRPERFTLPDFQRWAQHHKGAVIGWFTNGTAER
jgi:hypothetical protein